MPDGTMTLENYIPESAKMMRSIQTPQENIDKFGKDAPKDLLGAEADPDKEARDRADYERTVGGSDYDKGRTIESLLARHPDPETVRYALRDLQLSEETFNTNGEPDNRWEVSHRFRVLADRSLVLKMPVSDLIKRNLIEPLDNDEKDLVRKQRGKTIPANINENFLAKPRYVDGFGFETYGVSVPSLESFKVDEAGNFIDKRFRLVPQTFVYLGTENERKEKSGDFDLLKDEVSARTLMMQMWGHHTTYYYALQKLTEGHYFGTTLSSEGVGILFNLKGQEGAKKETVTKVETKNLGQKIDIAMRLYYVAALSEKPERFKKELMESPGWKQFLFPEGTKPEVIEKWIGQPNAWKKEVEAGGDRTEETLSEEKRNLFRGKLTQRNIFADVDTFDEGNLDKAVEEFLGGGEGASHVDKIEAETARRIGNRMFRLFLLADQEGYELFKETPKGNKMDPFDGIKVVFSNAPQASDYGKLTHPDLYAAKSMRKTRDYMPPVGFLHAREYYSCFMVDFLRHASANTQIKVSKDGVETRIVEERSLMERWWGYKGGFEKNGVTYLGEQGVRLGDLPWSKFNEPIDMSPEDAALLALPVGGYHHETYKGLWLSGFMAGGTDRAHQIISETNHNPKNFTDLHWWNKFWKMLDVGIKPSVVLQGKFRGVSDTEKKQLLINHKVKIVENFIMGLQSLPQWDEWEREEIKIKSKETRQNSEPQLVERIIKVANEALISSGVRVKLPSYYKDIAVRTISK